MCSDLLNNDATETVSDEDYWPFWIERLIPFSFLFIVSSLYQPFARVTYAGKFVMPYVVDISLKSNPQIP